VYPTPSGLGATWYFLNGTNYYPEYRVLESFKRAPTTSFRSACIATLLLTIIWLLRIFLYSRSEKQGGLLRCLRLCALCLLRGIDSCIGFVNRYGLIYCATFGVPFREGCRRWTELSFHEFVDLILRGSVIEQAAIYNFVLFVVGATLLGFRTATGAISQEKELARKLAAVGTLILTIAIFTIFQQPIRSISNTLFVCFAEAPNRLKSSAEELYDRLAEPYGTVLAEAATKDQIPTPSFHSLSAAAARQTCHNFFKKRLTVLKEFVPRHSKSPLYKVPRSLTARSSSISRSCIIPPKFALHKVNQTSPSTPHPQQIP
jgi:hypothetical protein